MSLIAAKNIIYQQISALHGYHVDEKSKMRSFLNQVTAQVLFNDRKMFENHNFLACYGGCHDIYIDRNEMSVTDFLKTFSKFDIEIDQINSFLFHNLRTSFS